MLNSITILKDWRTFKKYDTYGFNKGINIIVGENGCGKSSLIQLILEKHDDISNTIVSEMQPYVFFDFEKMNPRSQTDISSYTDVISRFMSHGETNNSIIHALNDINKQTIILMDEPDNALSIKSIIKLIDIINKLLEIGCQFIISCHNPLLIMNYERVLSLDDKKWIDSIEYINRNIPQNIKEKLLGKIQNEK